MTYSLSNGMELTEAVLKMEKSMNTILGTASIVIVRTVLVNAVQKLML